MRQRAEVAGQQDRTDRFTSRPTSRRASKGRLLDTNLARLRTQLEDSRDYLFSAAGIAQDLFR